MLPWWLVVPLWIGYVLMYDGYELVLLGVCMDAYMGTEGMWSVFYTCAAAIVVVSGLLLKPRLAHGDDVLQGEQRTMFCANAEPVSKAVYLVLGSGHL